MKIEGIEFQWRDRNPTDLIKYIFICVLKMKWACDMRVNNE